MSIMALVDGKKYSKEISKELLLVHLSQIYVNDIAFLIEKAFLRNHADESARCSIKKNTSLTNLFLRKILSICKNDFMTIICFYSLENINT